MCTMTIIMALNGLINIMESGTQALHYLGVKELQAFEYKSRKTRTVYMTPKGH